MTSCLKKTQQFFNHFQHLCVLKKIKKQEKQHEGRPLSNASLNFIQNRKYCNCCMRSFREVLAVEAETITCYRFCFIQKTLNGKVDTACPSNKAQIQQLPLSLWLACELTLDGSPVMTESVWTWASHPWWTRGAGAIHISGKKWLMENRNTQELQSINENLQIPTIIKQLLRWRKWEVLTNFSYYFKILFSLCFQSLPYPLLRLPSLFFL